MIKRLFLWLALVVPGYTVATQPDMIWQTGGLEPLRYITAKSAYDESPWVVQVSNHTVRCFVAFGNSILWSVSAPEVFGAAAISPNRAVVFHRNRAGTDRIQVRYTASGNLREEFAYTFDTSVCQIVSESANRIYVLHGSKLDELTRVSAGNWARTYRWQLENTQTSKSDTWLALAGSQHLIVVDGLVGIKTFNRTIKSQTPINLIPSTPRSYRFDIAVSDDGTQLVATTLDVVLVYRTSDWALVSTISPTGSVRSVDFFVNGDLCVLHSTSDTTSALSRITVAGAVLWTTTSFASQTFRSSIASTGQSFVSSWGGKHSTYFASTGNNLGLMGRTGKVNFICPGDEQVFVVNDRNEIIGQNNIYGSEDSERHAGLFSVRGADYGSGRLVWSDSSITKILRASDNVVIKTIFKGANAHQVGYRTVAASRGVVPSAGVGLAGVATSGGIFFYSLGNGSQFHSMPEFSSDYRFLQFSGNGQRFVGIRANSQVKIWSTSVFPGGSQAEGSFATGGFVTAGLSPDGNMLLITKLDGSVVVYTRNGNAVWALSDTLQVGLPGAKAESVSFAPDGSRFLLGVVGANGGQVEIWNSATLSRQLTFEDSGFCRVAAFGLTGQAIYYTGYSAASETNDGLVKSVWNPFRAVAPWHISPKSSFVNVGGSRLLSLYLTAPAPSDGFVVAISTSVPGKVSVPTNVTFAAGERYKQFAAVGVSAGTTVVAAAKNGVVAKSVLEVWP
ncbi:MAG TPA: WD40 repeat domain-containing protein [Fimbriimonadaceae bacterium]|nr:WD40 repeat domain-containing protein [Fimbriimonadaceae bacterium]